MSLANTLRSFRIESNPEGGQSCLSKKSHYICVGRPECQLGNIVGFVVEAYVDKSVVKVHI